MPIPPDGNYHLFHIYYTKNLLKRSVRKKIGISDDLFYTLMTDFIGGEKNVDGAERHNIFREIKDEGLLDDCNLTPIFDDFVNMTSKVSSKSHKQIFICWILW